MPPSNSKTLPNLANPAPSYAETHAHRYIKSLEWLKPVIEPGTSIYELGGTSPFTKQLEALDLDLIVSEHDLRKASPMKSNFIDVVLCMEVIEHIGDTDGLHTEWAGDGARVMLKEALRVLKPGGVLFLTTPNAASIAAIYQALRLAPPMIYRPHVREYAPYELDEIVRGAGFIIERRETLDVWRNTMEPKQHQSIADFIYHHGYPTALRGEDIFLLARKPILPKANIAPKTAPA